MLLEPGVSLVLKKSGFNEHMLTWPHNLASSPLLTSSAPRKPLAHCLSNRRIIRVVIEECQVKLLRNLSLITTLKCVSYTAWHGGSWGIILRDSKKNCGSGSHQNKLVMPCKTEINVFGESGNYSLIHPPYCWPALLFLLSGAGYIICQLPLSHRIKRLE